MGGSREGRGEKGKKGEEKGRGNLLQSLRGDRRPVSHTLTSVNISNRS